jgi:toxin ParE1/3/4
MPEIQFTNAARRDLKGIFIYSTRKWGKHQAKLYADQLLVHVEKIANDAVFSKNISNNLRDLRQSSVGRHLIIFEQTDDQILIVRILHEAMDIARHIGLSN